MAYPYANNQLHTVREEAGGREHADLPIEVYKGPYSLGSGSTNMNKLSLSKSNQRRKDNVGVLMAWACWVYDHLPEPIASTLNTLWYRVGLNEFWDKHASKLFLNILVLVWYLSAIFAITTSKVIMLKVTMPYTLCTCQFVGLYRTFLPTT